jgi:hypothetical protein
MGLILCDFRKQLLICKPDGSISVARITLSDSQNQGFTYLDYSWRQNCLNIVWLNICKKYIDIVTE